GLGNHLQRQVVANGDALRAPFALAGVDDDVEHAPFALLLGWSLVVFAGLRPLLGEQLAVGWVGNRVHLLLPVALAQYFAQDGRIGAERHAIHAASAILLDVLRDVGSDVTEVAQRGGSGRNQ